MFFFYMQKNQGFEIKLRPKLAIQAPPWDVFQHVSDVLPSNLEVVNVTT